MKRFNWVFLVGVLIAALAACTTNKPRLPDQSEDEAEEPRVLVDAYKMGVGDQVQITVWKNPELSVSEPIRPDGKIAVPLIGDIEAAGKEPQQLCEDITEKLSGYVRNPNVTVILTNLRGHEFLSRIRITGAVANNTSMTYHQGMTVLDAVLDAGSVTIYADSNRTKLHRRTEKGTETYDIRLKDIMENGDMTTNVLLLPGDIITVPERIF